MKTFNTFAVAAIAGFTAFANSTDLTETSLDLYMVSSKYHYDLQRMINGGADEEDIADLTRSYTQELETAVLGLALFDHDTSLEMLTNARMEELKQHAEGAHDAYVDWFGENQNLFQAVRNIYSSDFENFDIVQKALARSVDKVLDLLADTVDFLPHY